MVGPSKNHIGEISFMFHTYFSNSNTRMLLV